MAISAKVKFFSLNFHTKSKSSSILSPYFHFAKKWFVGAMKWTKSCAYPRTLSIRLESRRLSVRLQRDRRKSSRGRIYLIITQEIITVQEKRDDHFGNGEGSVHRAEGREQRSQTRHQKGSLRGCQTGCRCKQLVYSYLQWNVSLFSDFRCNLKMFFSSIKIRWPITVVSPVHNFVIFTLIEEVMTSNLW